MRKKVIGQDQQEAQSLEPEWMNLEEIVTVELSSEDTHYPIESALIPGQTSEWRAAEAGKQSLRLLFDQPQQINKICLSFIESNIERTQEFVLRCLLEQETSFQEIVRQQWNFSPDGTNEEREEYKVNLKAVMILELIIVPDISGGDSRASLAQLQLA
jgi:hypothetical protein